jgi:hypothetical protein
MNTIRCFAAVLCILLMVGAEGFAKEKGTQGRASGAALGKTDGSPVYTYMNINNISTVLRDNGTADIDPTQNNSGLVFPKGSRKTAIFESGLLWAARVPGDPQVRVGGSAYSSGLQPGKYLSPGVAEDPNLDKNRIYRVRPDWRAGDVSSEITDESMTAAQVRARYQSDWNEWPWLDGAPYVDVDGNGAYNPAVDVPGVKGASQTIWFVANDANVTNVNNLYGAQPVGMECQVTIWAYAQEGALGNMIFKSYLMINKGTTQLDSMYVCQWSDPDLGFSDDDLVGCDTTLSLGYVYNSNPIDATYSPLPPPAAGFDFFQGPRVPSSGSTATYRGKRIDGYRNLPMTAFFYFIKSNPNLEDPTRADPSGSTQFYNFMRGRIGRSGAYFQDPQGIPTTFCLTGDPVAGTGWVDGHDFPAADRRMGLASGPFSMAVGDTQEVVVAEICAGAMSGVDRLSAITLLKFYDKVAQAAYDNFFEVPAPPASPETKATELDQQILLNWGSNPDAVSLTEGSVVGSYHFQGYNIYQLPTASSTTSEGRKVAVFDIADGVTRVTDQVFDATVGVVTSKVVQLGTDSGIRRTLTVNADALNSNSRLINGVRYYFAVTAYSYTSDPNAIPNNLESSPKVITVIPHTLNPGVRFSSVSGDTIAPVNHTGPSAGSVVPIVVDPSRTTGQSYAVRFEDNGGTITWKLVNTAKGDTLLRGQTNQTGDDDYLITDGLQVKVLGPTPGMAGYATASNGQRDITWAGADPNGGYTSSMEGYNGAIAMGPNWSTWAGYDAPLVTAAQLKNTKLVFAAADGTWDPMTAQTDANFSRAHRYLRSAGAPPAQPAFAPWIVNPIAGGYAYQDYNWSVPFAAYDMESTPPRRLMVGHLENNRAGGSVDGRYWPPASSDASVDNTASEQTREWFFIFDVTYDPNTPSPQLTRDILNEATPVMWWGIVTRRAAAPNTAALFRAGTEFTIQANHVNSTSDVFSFTAPAVSYSTETAKNDVSKINVFPNPYYGVNTEELNKYNRFVTFSHLPQEAVIKIYNLAGIQVREIRKNSDNQFERWDLANESGFPVGSGLYVVHIDMPALGTTKILKVAVVQEQQILDRY